MKGRHETYMPPVDGGFGSLMYECHHRKVGNIHRQHPHHITVCVHTWSPPEAAAAPSRRLHPPHPYIHEPHPPSIKMHWGSSGSGARTSPGSGSPYPYPAMHGPPLTGPCFPTPTSAVTSPKAKHCLFLPRVLITASSSLPRSLSLLAPLPEFITAFSSLPWSHKHWLFLLSSPRAPPHPSGTCPACAWSD